LPTSRHTIDRDYLLELIIAFPYSQEHPISLAEANKKIHSRHAALSWENRSSIIPAFPESIFTENLDKLPKVLHSFLFQKILSNAGEYRKSSEPGSGIVRFGATRQYSGSHPSHIAEATQTALDLLKPTSAEPIRTALKFYQQFVFIHPFYDANGRIGRFIVSLYLHYHGFILDWEKLEKTSKWLTTINKCHDRMNARGEVYELYIGYMVKHWKLSIRELPSGEL